jgi:hypothetical protein
VLFEPFDAEELGEDRIPAARVEAPGLLQTTDTIGAGGVSATVYFPGTGRSWDRPVRAMGALKDTREGISGPHDGGDPQR